MPGHLHQAIFLLSCDVAIGYLVRRNSTPVVSGLVSLAGKHAIQI
jgi:hypothetical protein